MISCKAEHCDYFEEYGECASICEKRGIKKIVTNFDRIKAMSLEELAIFISTPCECGEIDPEKDGYVECGNDLCIKRLIKWLESEVDENE